MAKSMTWRSAVTTKVRLPIGAFSTGFARFGPSGSVGGPGIQRSSRPSDEAMARRSSPQLRKRQTSPTVDGPGASSRGVP